MSNPIPSLKGWTRNRCAGAACRPSCGGHLWRTRPRQAGCAGGQVGGKAPGSLHRGRPCRRLQCPALHPASGVLPHPGVRPAAVRAPPVRGGHPREPRPGTAREGQPCQGSVEGPSAIPRQQPIEERRREGLLAHSRLGVRNGLEHLHAPDTVVPRASLNRNPSTTNPIRAGSGRDTAAVQTHLQPEWIWRLAIPTGKPPITALRPTRR
jgi:hypothetical protein